MKTRSHPETENQFTGADKDNGRRKIWLAKLPGGLGPESISPVNSLCGLRYLLFNPLSVAVLAGAAVLASYEGMKQREDEIPTLGKPRLKETLPLLRSKFEVRRFKVRSSPFFPPIRVHP